MLFICKSCITDFCQEFYCTICKKQTSNFEDFEQHKKTEEHLLNEVGITYVPYLAIHDMSLSLKSSCVLHCFSK